MELLKLGISHKAKNNDGNAPLHVAAKSGNVGVAKALCECGADVKARNSNNRTARMIVRCFHLLC